jgi:hypothetical protein
MSYFWPSLSYNCSINITSFLLTYQIQLKIINNNPICIVYSINFAFQTKS